MCPGITLKEVDLAVEGVVISLDGARASEEDAVSGGKVVAFHNVKVAFRGKLTH